jgi:hypothetical protein
LILLRRRDQSVARSFSPRPSMSAMISCTPFARNTLAAYVWSGFCRTFAFGDEIEFEFRRSNGVNITRGLQWNEKTRGFDEGLFWRISRYCAAVAAVR